MKSLFAEHTMSIIRRFHCVCSVLMLAALGTGCQGLQRQQGVPPVTEAVPVRMPPRELAKTILPSYIIEPPDVLLIDAVHVVPRPPYHLRTLDMLSIQVQGTLPDAPIAGTFTVEPGGLVKLGAQYGSVKLGGLTVEEAEAVTTKHLLTYLKEPVVSVTLADTAAKQQIAGQHLVGPDGTVTLGTYGSVQIVGMTIAEARAAVEHHLSQYLENPEISLDVFAYNSKVYYIVTQGAGMGDGVFRFPVKGNETVLDAISEINGLQHVSSTRIWIARPTDDPCQVQILPVKWEDITAQASACTNYQILPGDRVFIAEDKLIAFDTGLAKITAPLERIMGFSLLGVGTATRFSGAVLKGGGNPTNNF
jgi:polysaccharide export outer membrane protein